MKKKHLLGIGLLGLLSWCLGIILTFWGFHGSASANNTSCKDVEFPNGVTACVNIKKISTNRRSLITQLNGWSGSYLRCDGLMTPDSLLRNPDDSFRNISSCNGEFSYNRTKVGTVKLWIKYNNTAPIDRDDKPSNNSERTYPQWAYNFNTEERAKNNVIDTNNDSNYDADNFYVTTDDATPTLNQQVDLTVQARDGTTKDTTYRGKIQFEVYKKASNATIWTLTTSANDFTMTSTYKSNGYRFTTSNAWQKTFSNLISFKRTNYSYKVLVYDEDYEDIQGYKIFTVNETTNNNNNTSNYNTDNFSLTTDDATPTLNQKVDLTVQARDGTTKDTTYRGKIQFEVYKKASNATIWTLTTSANDFTMISTYKSNGYTFTKSNAWQKTFSNLISFKRTNYSYKVLVYDEDYEDIQGYKIFTVGNVNTSSSNSSVDGFTTSELNTVESIYDARNNMINNLEKTYPRLINNSRRQNMSDDLYDEMGLVLDDDNDRMYSDFDEFYDAFLEWYRYTVSIK